MRRLLAILLAFSFSFPLMLSLAAAQSGAGSLPACCRRDGKHKCGMASRRTEPRQTGWKTSVCASYPTNRSTVAEREDALPGDADHGPVLTVAERVAGHVPDCAPAQQRGRERQRGPPVLL